MTFPAQSPDLRRFPLVAGASRSVVRSPRSAAPRIRFLFVDSRVRFTLRSAYASRRTPCASLRSLRPGSGRTFTSKSSPMPGPPQCKRESPLLDSPVFISHYFRTTSHSRGGRIELRGPSAPSARLAEIIRIYSRALQTLGSNLRFCGATSSPHASSPPASPLNPSAPTEPPQCQRLHSKIKLLAEPQSGRPDSNRRPPEPHYT